MKTARPLLQIANRREWIERSAAARIELVRAHGFADRDFTVLDRNTRSGAVLYFSQIYPRKWGELLRYDGDVLVSGFVKDNCIPVGLTVHWPAGVDFTGEAYDPKDPIHILDECEFWAGLSREDMAEMLA